MTAPVTILGFSSRSSCRAMASEVAAWSPVIIFTAMPAERQSRIAASTSSRGGSMRPSNPTSALADGSS